LDSTLALQRAVKISWYCSSLCAAGCEVQLVLLSPGLLLAVLLTSEALRSMAPKRFAFTSTSPYLARNRQAQEAADTPEYMSTMIVIYASYFRMFHVSLVRRPGLSLVNDLEPLQFICACTDPLRLSHYDVTFNQENQEGWLCQRQTSLNEGMFAVVRRPSTVTFLNTVLSYQSNSSLALVRISDMDSIAGVCVNVTQFFNLGDWMNPELTFQIHTVAREAGDNQLITTIYTCRAIPDVLYDMLEENLESFDC
jgi:hypothetical protein